jgi:hypothetical protein
MNPFKIAGLLSLMILLSLSYSAFGQVEPDTVKRKRELPTGPPGVQPQPRTQPRVIQQTTPPVIEKGVQEEDEKIPFKDRLYTGGSFGLQFGTYTNISLLPILGYQVTEKWSVGTGIVYHYIRSGSLSLNNYGGRAFTQLELLPIGDGALIAHTEVEILSSEYFIIDQSNQLQGKGRRVISIPMAGIGYRQRIGDRASFDILLLYNFRQGDEANPYDNPVFRAGFNIPLTRR